MGVQVYGSLGLWVYRSMGHGLSAVWCTWGAKGRTVTQTQPGRDLAARKVRSKCSTLSHTQLHTNPRATRP